MLFKQSMVVSTHIEAFFISSEHKLLPKINAVRKFGVQTFALIKLETVEKEPCLYSQEEGA